MLLPIPPSLPLPNLSKPQSGWEVNLNRDVFLNELDPRKWTREMLRAIGPSKQVVIECVHVPQWTFQALIENEDRWLWADSDQVTPAGPSFPPGAIRFFSLCRLERVNGKLAFYREHSKQPFLYRDEGEERGPDKNCLDSDASTLKTPQFLPRAPSEQPRQIDSES